MVMSRVLKYLGRRGGGNEYNYLPTWKSLSADLLGTTKGRMKVIPEVNCFECVGIQNPIPVRRLDLSSGPRTEVHLPLLRAPGCELVYGIF